MRCTSPRTVGFLPDGKTISWSHKTYSKEFATFQLPCGKCIDCRLDYARQWAIRCVHEAQMHEKNAFITLTYDDAHLGDNKLDYRDFQLFMKKLRKTQNDPIGVFVTGEYGEKSKRKHWHALLFNWRPSDCEYKYSNERGDRIFSSKTLSKIWTLGIAELGSVTFESAGYCARYSAKKLVHGKDNEHDFDPISKKSSKHAIGKTWLERYYKDVFNYGTLVLPGGHETAIPRYYEKWLQKNHPEEWVEYITRTKQEKISRASQRAAREKETTDAVNSQRVFKGPQTSREKARKEITKQKFNKLQANLKL